MSGIKREDNQPANFQNRKSKLELVQLGNRNESSPTRPPHQPTCVATFALPLVGHPGIKKMYDDGIGNAATVSTHDGVSLIFCTCCSPYCRLRDPLYWVHDADTLHAGLVLSSFGLSAFWSSEVVHVFFPGDTSAFLLVLALGTAIPMLIGPFTIRSVPLPLPSPGTKHDATTEGYNHIPIADDGVFIANPEGAEIDAEEACAPFLSYEYEHSSCLPSGAILSG
ncbi:hypothetical protein PAXINDRAFT_13969 [Paxillus involutus ATCC 200175]|uniref:Uncharacterized protein n=1 Tax=Paxillus involutus ATCC 200175 TaxID=664439 RepID=A0A0C9SVA6_PAXIN|nr:hypothetical protein PAXINDRAFT_13969 [Paxillus involutus ATCC 200175]